MGEKYKKEYIGKIKSITGPGLFKNFNLDIFKSAVSRKVMLMDINLTIENNHVDNFISYLSEMQHVQYMLKY